MEMPEFLTQKAQEDASLAFQVGYAAGHVLGAAKAVEALTDLLEESKAEKDTAAVAVLKLALSRMPEVDVAEYVSQFKEDYEASAENLVNHWDEAPSPRSSVNAVNNGCKCGGNCDCR